MQKVLITGAQGMLGSDLMQVLNSTYDLVGVDIEDFDITNPEDTRRYINDIHPDWVIHTAAFTRVDECEINFDTAMEVNATGTRNVASAARDVNAKIIAISTDYIFDGRSIKPYTEDERPNPACLYGQTKLAGEREVMEVYPPGSYTILRTAWLFGEHGNNFVKAIHRKLRKSKEIIGVVDDQRGSPTYSVDLACAIGLLLQREPVGIINVTNSGSCTWYEFAREIARGFGYPKERLKPITTEELGLLAPRPAYSVLSMDKFRRLTDQRLRSWQEALKNYIIKTNEKIKKKEE